MIVVNGRAPAGQTLDPKRDEAIVKTVARLRQLPLRGRLTIRHSVDSDPDSRRVSPIGDREKAQWLAFGYAWPTIEREHGGKVAVGTSAAGTYFRERREIVLYAPTSLPESEQPEYTDQPLAHESVHFLQRTSGALKRLHTGPPGDDALARSALSEGDANFTTYLVSLMRHGGSLEEAATFASHHVAGVDVATTASEEANERRIHGSFVYRIGMRFVERLYRTGGFPLVNRAYSSPPVSTAQVIHPELYIAGVQPIEVPRPPVPSGSRSVAAGTLGEWGLRSLLAGCLSVDVARAAASGWAGDEYSVVVRDKTEVSLQWTTVFDSEAAAKRFAAAMTSFSTTRCITTPPRDAEPYFVRSGFRVEQNGTRVDVERGFASNHVNAPINGAAGFKPRPARPPFGAVSLAAAATRDAPHKVKLIDGEWHSDRLGLRCTVGKGFVATLIEDLNAIEVVGHGYGSLFLVAKPFAGQLEELKRGMRDDPTLKTSAEDRVLPWGATRSILVSGGPSSGRVTLLSACGGAAAWFLIERWKDVEEKAALEAWSASLMPTSATVLPPVCETLSKGTVEPAAR